MTSCFVADKEGHSFQTVTAVSNAAGRKVFAKSTRREEPAGKSSSKLARAEKEIMSRDHFALEYESDRQSSPPTYCHSSIIISHPNPPKTKVGTTFAFAKTASNLLFQSHNTPRLLFASGDPIRGESEKK